MTVKTSALISIFFLLLGTAWFASGVRASPAALQVAFPSPTPGPDGRIIYVVKAGDTCVQLSLLYGVTLDYLRNTNQLNANCDLREGQKLMLGYGGPSASSPTPGPSPLPTLALPTPTALAGGMAEVCILVYDDPNGDGLRQESEVAIAGAAISLTSLDGTFSQTKTTVLNPDPEAYQGMCFSSVPMGRYSLSSAAPEGYNPTTEMTSTVDVKAGDSIYVDYGVQSGSSPQAAVSSKKSSPLLGVIGAAFLLVGIGLAVLLWTSARRK